MSDVSQIDGSAVRLCREAQGWAINDLAARACLSVKQVRQIEEGGLSSFYSESVKLTAARKIAALLQLSEDQLFGQVPPATSPLEEEALFFASQSTPASVLASITTQPFSVPDKTQTDSSGVHLIRSEALHILAQPPEIDWTSSSPEADETRKAQDLPKTLVNATAIKDSSSTAAEVTSPSGNYFLKILVLFLVAIAVAALMRPRPVEPAASSPEASTGQSMTPPVAPAAGESSTSETGAGAAAELAAGQADGKPSAASDLSPVNPIRSSGAVPATAPAAKAPSER